MRAALEELRNLGAALMDTSLVLCTDSQAALAMPATGAGAQWTALGADIWRLLLDILSQTWTDPPAVGPHPLRAPWK